MDEDDEDEDAIIERRRREREQLLQKLNGGTNVAAPSKVVFEVFYAAIDVIEDDRDSEDEDDYDGFGDNGYEPEPVLDDSPGTILNIRTVTTINYNINHSCN